MNSAALHITGMSWSTPLGEEINSVWQQLVAGRDGFTELASSLPLRNTLVACVHPPVVEMGHRDRMVALTSRGILAACTDAGLDITTDDVAIVVGTSYGSSLDEEASSLYEWIELCANMIGFRGKPILISTACSAASDALMVGAELVRSGAYRAAVCGGADVVTPAKRLAHSKLGTMSSNRLCAFDVEHSGMLLGEGAGFVIIEEDVERHGRSYAVLRGAGSSNDAVSMTAPAEDGYTVRLAIDRALRSAELSIEDIAVVSAHGTGTVLNDEAEARGFLSAFGKREEPPVTFATKGALGHSLGACGAIEAISLILALRNQMAPPIVGLRTPIREAEPFVRPGSQRICGTAGISITLGFGGFNTVLAFSTEGVKA